MASPTLDANGLHPPQLSLKRKRMGHDIDAEIDANGSGLDTHKKRTFGTDSEPQHQGHDDNQLAECTPPRPQHYLRDEGSTDSDIRQCLMKAMTSAQQTQARAYKNTLVLTGKLHDWFRHVDQKDRTLYKAQCGVIRQQQMVIKRHLKAATGYMDRLNDALQHCKNTRASSAVAQVKDMKSLIEILESNMEVLILELQVERHARDAAEKALEAMKEQLRLKKPVDSPMESPEEGEIFSEAPPESPIPGTFAWSVADRDETIGKD
ncbi:hypothetical protein E8E13_007918 [Curvularia kusanoi]|uniref:Uncharacterized protein n=1 Tax=Curvularia kusanoi TaxID=90978 RepID=A0A9P4TCL3_CURKU|nr:hypothetical protein E8E13_007918 [Curvularia kusanoi]